MPSYRKMFFDDPKDFFQRYSINLPADPREAGKIGELELMQSTMKGVGGQAVKKIESFHKFKKTESGSFDVTGLAHNAAWQVDEGQKKATLVVRKALGTVEAMQEAKPRPEYQGLEWFLCVMLPWIQNGVTTMEMRKDTRADAFFTGAMNGCSFVVTGDPAAPHVSHINCATAEEYDEKYDKVLEQFGSTRDKTKQLARNDYKLDQERIAAHEHVAQEQLRMKNQKLVEPIITDTLCFVMGRRVNAKWEFFYQRVITQRIVSKQKLGKTGGLVKLLGRDHRQNINTTVYRSISAYNRLWPDGPGRLAM